MNFFKILKNNHGKLKDFISSVIAGLFSGTAVGIFFSLTTNITFNRWINLFSFELVPAIVYFIFFLFILLIFYCIGSFITKFIWKDNKRLFGFYINFISGTYSSALSFLLVLYYKNILTLITLLILGIIILFILAYFTVKRKWQN